MGYPILNGQPSIYTSKLNELLRLFMYLYAYIHVRGNRNNTLKSRKGLGVGKGIRESGEKDMLMRVESNQSIIHTCMKCHSEIDYFVN